MTSIRTRWGRDPALHACAGVLCARHEKCARYAFVDGTTEPSSYWLPACYSATQRDFYPAFIDRRFVGPPAPEQWFFNRRAAQKVRSRRGPFMLNPA